MKEQLITFQVAKLAKEKGFNDPTIHWYHIHTKKLNSNELLFSMNRLTNNYAAPTQSTLQRWMRETHDILIYVDPKSHHIFQYHIITPDNEIIGSERLNNWEQALEDGLQKALKLIKLK